MAKVNSIDSERNSIYKEWKDLVNMSHSELSAFLKTQEGKDAGMSRSEAKEEGISSGQDSARAILRMLKKNKTEWAESDYKWAKKQINFIKRMSGNKGSLFDDKGNKTRKHTSLLLWGHNFKKMAKGGPIDDSKINCNNCDWNWEVKDGGDDLYICHKCTYDNEKHYNKMEKGGSVEDSKIVSKILLKKEGGVAGESQWKKGDYVRLENKSIGEKNYIKGKTGVAKILTDMPNEYGMIKAVLIGENGWFNDEAYIRESSIIEIIEDHTKIDKSGSTYAKEKEREAIEDRRKKELIKFSKEALEFVPKVQLSIVISAPQEFQDVIIRINKAVSELPKTYGQDGVKDKMIYLHYFYGDMDWHIVEKDSSANGNPNNPDEESGHLQDYGYADIGYGPEMGYISIDELKTNKRIELDFYFEPKLWSEVNEDSKVVEEEISLKISSYSNPYELNRGIEKLIDSIEDKDLGYTSDQKEFISYYSGYGGLEKKGSFSREELKGLLYEYYTPDDICKKMWALAYKYGYGVTGDSSVFEPSVGTGNFLKYAPKNVIIKGNEINKYSAIICSVLYPEADIELKSFETNFIKNNSSIKGKIENLKKYSLIIGNPPYGKLGGKYITMGDDNHTKARNWVEYFITRGLDLLHKDGLLIYVVGAEQHAGGTLFLDGADSKVKQEIFKKAYLIDAYRLPINTFERTGVSTEILIFKRK